MNDRKLSTYFIQSLTQYQQDNPGILNPVLKRVQEDKTLDLQIRQGYININYRGGNILWIKELKGSGFEFQFDHNYAKGYPYPANLFSFKGKYLNSTKNVDEWLAAIPYLKDIMDSWFGKHPKEEREYQQHVVRDNNYSSISGSTDYFFLDIEYDNRKGNSSAKGARFDLLAFQWNSDGVSRKLTSRSKPRLCCIEMKYGDKALNGKAGLNTHFDDFCAFSNSTNNIKDLKSEALELFHQKRELGLISGLTRNKNVIRQLDEPIDFIILAANHDPAKSNFRNGLNYIHKNLSMLPPGIEVKVCESSNMGYGLYKEKVLLVSDYLKKNP